MVVKDKKIEKVYSSYVSEYHLEMILVPFINSKIEEKENVVIETEYDMNETLNTLLSKLNLKEENKEKILRLGWNKKENNIVISITDFAGGLPKEVQDRLFKEMVTTKGKNGTGLGLYMSYSNIKAHFGGDITYVTETGKGTTFNIIIPLR